MIVRAAQEERATSPVCLGFGWRRHGVSRIRPYIHPMTAEIPQALTIHVRGLYQLPASLVSPPGPGEEMAERSATSAIIN